MRIRGIQGILSLWFIFECIPLHAQKIESLQKTRAFVLETLSRVENGSSPCFQESCQKEKARMLLKLEAELERLAWSTNETPNLSAAFDLTREVRRELNYQPKKLKEWLNWWRHRYSLTPVKDANWMYNFESIVSTQKAFELVLQFVQQDVFILDRLQEVWSEDFRESAVALKASVLSEGAANQAELRGDLLLARKKSNEAERFRQKLRTHEQALGKSFPAILKEVFPDRITAEGMELVIHMDRWCKLLHIDDLDDPDLVAFIESTREKWRTAFLTSQAWTDLEYGVIGLKNFDSTVNPQVAVTQELEVQKILDKVELIGQSLIDLAQYSFALAGVREISQGSKLLSFFGLFGSGYGIDKFDMRLGKQLIPPSTRTREILAQIPALEQRMFNRKESLTNAKKILEKKLLQIDQQIEKLKDNHGGEQ